MRILIWLGCLAAGTGNLLSEVAFGPAFSSGMVIQRDRPVRLSGTGTPGSEVSISLDAATRSARVTPEGRWTVEFPPLPAGGPHVLKAAEAETESVTLDDVLAGDVWLFSGQSNMQMGIRETVGGPEALAAAAGDERLRILTVPRGGADTPATKLDAEWQRFTAEKAGDFSAVATFFALRLREDPALAEVPLGLVNSSFGGTAIEAWTPAGTLPELPADQVSASMFGIPAGALFNGMISPLTGLQLKGAVWYQGEANAGHPTVYAGLLKNLIGQWRAAFRQPELPFLVVQLPAFDGRFGDYDFSWLREAQAAACRDTPRAWLVQTYETTDGLDLHPVEKARIGERAALLALREIHGAEVKASGPAFATTAVEGDRLRVKFTADGALRTTDGRTPAGFEIAGDDGEYRYAAATLDGASVLLHNEAVRSPVSVRFAWGAMPAANLTDASGLPAAPFRTDTRAPGTVTVQPLPVEHRVVTPVYQLTTGDNGQVASLMVKGKQFLSNEANGGTRFPDGWGQRNFARTEVLGPQRLRTSDATGSLEIVCAEDAMEWTVTNGRDGPVEFRIALSPRATAARDGDTARISRDEVRLDISGMDRLENGETPELILNVPAHEARTIRWKVAP